MKHYEGKNETDVKNQARKDVCDMLYTFLTDKFGEDKVRYVGNGKIGFLVGTVDDYDGWRCTVPCEIKPVIKNYQDHFGDKRELQAYDLYDAAEAYEKEYE